METDGLKIIFTHTYIHTYIHAHTHTYRMETDGLKIIVAHTYMHTYRHTYTHTYIQNGNRRPEDNRCGASTQLDTSEFVQKRHRSRRHHRIDCTPSKFDQSSPPGLVAQPIHECDFYTSESAQRYANAQKMFFICLFNGVSI
jgi:hypothetical protein